MNWANSSLKCQPCMGREANTRFKYCLIPVSIPEETGMKAFKKYPIPILARYEIHLKNPRIPGRVLDRYSKVDTRMTCVHSPSPMWTRTHKFNLFSFQIACFFPGFVKLLRLFISFVAFTISIPNPPFRVQWWAPFLVRVYCKEIVKEIYQKEKKNRRTVWKEITKDDYLITMCNVHSLACGVILHPIMLCSWGLESPMTGIDYIYTRKNGC